MSKFKSLIFILGGLLLCIVSSLATYFALAASGTIAPDSIFIEFTIQDEEKVYDGTPLIASSIDYNSDLLLEGNSVLIEYTGSQLDAGSSKSRANINIVDENGYDVTNKYSIKVNEGNLLVNRSEISISLANQEVEYNGQALSLESCDVIEGNLVPGHKIVPNVEGQVVNVGDRIDTSVVVYKVYDAVGNDVSKNYNVSPIANSENILITPRQLVIRPISSTKVYDGTPLYSDYEIVSGSLAYGQTLKVDFSNKYIVDVGETLSNITDLSVIDLFTNEEVDIDNYSITILSEYAGEDCGKLTILPRNINVSINNYSKVYDGNGISQTELSYTIDPLTPLANGQSFSMTYKPNQNDATDLAYCTEAGYYGLQADTYRIIENDNDVTSNYNVKINDSSITISKANLTVVAQSGSYTYDGLSHNIGTPSPTIYGLVSNNHEISDVVYSYSNDVDQDIENLREVGIYSIVVKSLTIKDKTSNKNVTDNYNTLFVTNSFEIKKAQLYIYLKSFEYTYNGEPVVDQDHANDIIAATSELSDLFALKYPYDDTVKTIYEPGTHEYYAGYKVYAKSVEGDSDFTKDVSENFDIIEAPGTIHILSPANLDIYLPNFEKNYDGTSIYDSVYTELEDNINEVNNLGVGVTLYVDATADEIRNKLYRTEVGKDSYTLPIKIIKSDAGHTYNPDPSFSQSLMTILPIDYSELLSTSEFSDLITLVGETNLTSLDKFLKLTSTSSTKISELLFVVDNHYVSVNPTLSEYINYLPTTGYFNNRLINESKKEIASNSLINNLQIDLAASGLAGSHLAVYAIKKNNVQYDISLNGYLGASSAEDVSDKYNLIIHEGTMSVNLVIDLADFSWNYNGMSLLANNYNLNANPAAQLRAEKIIKNYTETLNKLPEGYSIVLNREDAEYIGSLSKANTRETLDGEIGEEYTASFTIYDQNYVDVTEKFGISITPGTISIYRSNLLVDFANNQMITTYNGKMFELTQDDLKLYCQDEDGNYTLDPFPEGFVVKNIKLVKKDIALTNAEFEALLTNYSEGLIENIYVDKLQIYDNEGNDVTSNYNINYNAKSFSLTINKKNIAVIIHSISIYYDDDIIDSLEEMALAEIDPSSELAEGDYIDRLNAYLGFGISDTESKSYLIEEVDIIIRNKNTDNVRQNYNVKIIGYGVLTVTVLD